MSHTVIVVSKSMGAGKQMWKTGRKISYVPIGIEPPHFFSRSEATQFLGDIVLALKNNADVPKIFTIAELTPNKGIRYGIEAIASLKNRGVNALYIVIGDGEERAHLKSFARKCGVENRVFFTGFIRDAAQYLKASDVFLLPSIKEGMPYVLLEAAIAGLPIVTMTVVNPEITEAYQNIRAVPPANGEKIADALIDVMREKSEHELFPARNQFLLRHDQKTIELCCTKGQTTVPTSSVTCLYGGPRVSAETHEDTERKVLRNQVRAAVAHERERGPRNGQKAYVHANMHDKLGREIDCNTDTEEHIEIIGSTLCNYQYSNNQNRKKTEQKHDTNESPLFRKCSKDKISLILW